jgi:hypothetical protein
MAKVKHIKGLTIHFMPYSEVEGLDSTARIKKLLELVLKGKIIIIQGRLKADEETRLIEDTMIMVGQVKGFKGIELAVIMPDSRNRSIIQNMRHNLATMLVGDTEAITIVGPASIIKEMKKDPKKLEIFMSGI